MHGFIVLGFNGTVVFHTSPLTRAVVDHIVEIVQSDLHMSVSSQYYTSIVSKSSSLQNSGVMSGRSGGGAADSSGSRRGLSQRGGGIGGVVNSSFAGVNGGGASPTRSIIPESAIHRSGAMVDDNGGAHLLLSSSPHLTRSQTSALYRASVAINRAGGGEGADSAHRSSEEVERGARAAPSSGFFSTIKPAASSAAVAPTSSNYSANNFPTSSRRFKFTAKQQQGDIAGGGSLYPSSSTASGTAGGASIPHANVTGGSNLGGSGSMGTAGGGPSSSSGASGSAHSSNANVNSGGSSSYFISDTAYATSHCMARNVRSVCEGIVAVSPSEHAWLRHHITSFVVIGEPRREESDEDLIAADPEAVARIGVSSSNANGGAGGDSNGPGGFVLGSTAAFSENKIGGVGIETSFGHLRGDGPSQVGDDSTAALSDIFTKGITVVPASSTTTTNSQQHLQQVAGNNTNNPNTGLAVTPAVTAGGGVILDPTVSTSELFVTLYWRKVGDRVFILVLHEDDSIALAKHVLSTFIVILSEAFKVYVPEGALIEAGIVAGVGGGAGGGSGTATHMGLQHGHHTVASSIGGGSAPSFDAETFRLFAAMEKIMREDAALSQMPSLRSIIMRPDVVQLCLNIIAPHNIMAMVDLPMARVCLQRKMKGK